MTLHNETHRRNLLAVAVEPAAIGDDWLCVNGTANGRTVAALYVQMS
jgi:hypothetical protein